MSDFFKDAMILLGFEWSKHRKGKYPTIASKHDTIDKHTKLAHEKLIDAYTKVDEKTGKTFAKVAYENNAPEWYWLVNNLPKSVVDRIKQISDIDD